MTTSGGGFIDLLALDKQGNLVVLTLKRDKETHSLLVETLDHASWVNGLSCDHIDALTNKFTGKPLAQSFSDHFGAPLPDKVNARHSIIILVPESDDSAQRVVRYLSATHNVPIQVFLVSVFTTSSGEFVASARRPQPTKKSANSAVILKS